MHKRSDCEIKKNKCVFGVAAGLWVLCSELSMACAKLHQQPGIKAFNWSLYVYPNHITGSQAAEFHIQGNRRIGLWPIILKPTLTFEHFLCRHTIKFQSSTSKSWSVKQKPTLHHDFVCQLAFLEVFIRTYLNDSRPRIRTTLFQSYFYVRWSELKL